MNRIVLASASIGRKKLFQEAFTDFVTSVSNIDESRIKMDDPKELTKRLALLKARTISKFYPDDFVIGFDTVVVCENQVVGKPKDRDEAKAFLKFLSGKKQSVISGFCILNQKRAVEIVDCDETILLFKALDDAFINDYVNRKPVTKFAGAYGVQDDDDFIEIEEGSFDNVVGAPMMKILNYIKDYKLPEMKPIKKSKLVKQSSRKASAAAGGKKTRPSKAAARVKAR